MIPTTKNSSLKVSTKPYKPRPPKTEKQNQQWNKFRALGTISGFDGYLLNLQFVCNAVPGMAVEKLLINKAIETLRVNLRFFAFVLRKKPEPPK